MTKHEEAVDTQMKLLNIETADDFAEPGANDFSSLSDPVTIKERCIKSVPEWGNYSSSDLIVNQILSGLSNQLFCVELSEEKKKEQKTSRVLFRVYGSGVAKLYDPEFELSVFRELANVGIAPRLVAAFPGGRIEQWLRGATLRTADLHNPSILCAMACITAKFHGIASHPSFTMQRRAPCLETRIQMWKESALSALRTAPEPLRSRLASLKLVELAGEADELMTKILPRKLDGPALEVVFCHNDNQENNIMKGDKRLRLIDFEYSDFNYAAFDVANFFIEATMDYSCEEPPYYRVRLEDYPCVELRRLFASVYLSEKTGTSILPSSDAHIVPFLAMTERFVAVSNIMWGFWSAVRAMQATTGDPFDYVGYGEKRFNMYREKVKELMTQGILL
eukprot:GHVU01113759.1.p1 GENE.GHVU01113759.1~~GHVU01113759.1.p1  ORF type:complete len:436 (+),score=72.51 GHVU01113759.1:131-1309(+)